MPSASERIATIERIFGKGNLSGNSRNIEVWCPACAPSQRSKRKLSIKLDDGKYHCWVCDYSGLHVGTVVKRFHSREDLDELLKVFPWTGKKLNIVDTRVRPQLPKDFRLLALAGDAPDARACRAYLTRRGLDESDLWFYKFGMSRDFKWSRRVIMPSFDRDGELNYYTARAIDPDVGLRYMTAEADRTQVIFNELNVDWSKRLVLCEGPFDAVKCGSNVVPLLGNSLNENSSLFCNIVMHGTPIALALDNDMRVRTLQLVKKLHEYTIDAVVVDLGDHKDPGEMSKQEFAAALSSAKPLQWRSVMSERIERAAKRTLRVG